MSSSGGEAKKSGTCFGYHQKVASQDELALKDAEKTKAKREAYKSIQKAKEEKQVKVKIDGIIYDSITIAANKLGVSTQCMSTHWRKFAKGSFKEREIEIRIPKIIKLQKLTKKELNEPDN